MHNRKLLAVIFGAMHFGAIHLPGITLFPTSTSGSIPSLQYGQVHGLLCLRIFSVAVLVSPVWDT